MKKVIIASNPFRGSLSTYEATKAIAFGFQKAISNTEILQFPIGDGGDDTVSALVHHIGGTMYHSTVTDPLGRNLQAKWAILKDNKTAVIEVAGVSGIQLLPTKLRNPMKTTTYGIGELIKSALDIGCSTIIIWIGGSATVDGGAGMLQSLGVRLLDRKGKEIMRGGGGLGSLVRIDTSQIDKRIFDVKIIGACDASVRLLGPSGTAKIFSPQKGATDSMVRELEDNLLNYSRIISRDLGIDVSELAFGGAAGGLGSALYAFLNGDLEIGIERFFDLVGFEKLLSNCDLVLTGEGKLDEQTLRGKGPYGIAQVARKHGVPSIIFVGQTEQHADPSLFSAFDLIVPISSNPSTIEDSMKNASVLLMDASERVAKLLAMGAKLL